MTETIPPVQRRAPVPSGRGVRREIQALRALAVLLVVLYHLLPSAVRGGYVGVDVFFVVSGFLITGHLVRDTEAHGGVRPLEFWARRARRLMPASLLVLAVTLVGTLVIVPRSLWHQFLGEIAGSALYVQNWLLIATPKTGSDSPVQHFWSLSVEEQFYLVWPFVMIIAAAIVARRSDSTVRRAIVIAIAIVTVASFVFSLVVTTTVPDLAYFGTPSRGWAFGVGVLLALLAGTPTARRVALKADATWVGLVLIVVSAALFTDATPFPGVAALVPVGATLLVIWGAAAGAGPVLGWRPVQYVGDISYSVYLWHFAIIILADHLFASGMPVAAKVVVVVLIAVLAVLSKTFIEDPVRTSRLLASRPPYVTFLLTAAGMAVVVVAALIPWAMS